MADYYDKLNDDLNKKKRGPGEEDSRRGGRREKPMKAVDRLFLDEGGPSASNYTGDESSERDYRPVRQSHEYRSGCLGGLMYLVFVLCLSIVLACVAWMATSDMLALNKDKFTAVVSLPTSIFEAKTVDTYDENGVKTGTERVTRADIDFVASELKEAGLIEYKWLFRFFPV